MGLKSSKYHTQSAHSSSITELIQFLDEVREGMKAWELCEEKTVTEMRQMLLFWATPCGGLMSLLGVYFFLVF